MPSSTAHAFDLKLEGSDSDLYSLNPNLDPGSFGEFGSGREDLDQNSKLNEFLRELRGKRVFVHYLPV
jgi:hypothetical protein